MPNRKRYEVTCDSSPSHSVGARRRSFNTASGMRSHVTSSGAEPTPSPSGFQYRKRYEITCDERDNTENFSGYSFQYRKRYEVTCDATETDVAMMELMGFQYRKRYEITCDSAFPHTYKSGAKFQYRKRYEITCDRKLSGFLAFCVRFQYRKRYEITCDKDEKAE